MIAGESVTEQEVLAQPFHNWSARKEGAFVAINCGAIPRDLIESELSVMKKALLPARAMAADLANLKWLMGVRCF